MPDAKKLPMVSVIMNVRNGADTLAEAIESVLAQTYSDWEIIAWDDHSIDGSEDVIRRYADPRIRYVRSPSDENLGRAREHALQQAEGKWLAFLDQDDIWLPRKLERQMALAGPGISLIYGRSVAFYASGREVEYDLKHEFAPLPEGDIFEELFRSGCFIAMSSAIVSRQAWRAIGQIPEEVTITPDYYLYAGAARHGQARAVQEVVCRYRRHARSMSGSRHCRIHEECIWLLNHWLSNLPADVVAHRLRIHYTVAAYHKIIHWKTVFQGFKTLLTRGSIPFLLSRPLVRASRSLRRTVKRPFWMNPQLSE